jgi:DNA-binding NtrC family response regulator
MIHTLLLVEDEETLRESLSRLFTKEGLKVDAADSAEAGLSLAEENSYDVIISDIILPGMDGIEMLTRIKEKAPQQIFIVVTAYASLDTAVRALKIGAYDYIMKPIMHEEIKQVVRNALKQRRLETENALLKRQIQNTYDFLHIIGETGSLKGITDEVRKVSDSPSSVLLLGETGTGKELFARVIHQGSSRAEMPFVPINCSAIPETLLETELFGHMKGAFTGAVASKPGLLEEANGGTVFLDEIGDMPSTCLRQSR